MSVYDFLDEINSTDKIEDLEIKIPERKDIVFGTEDLHNPIPDDITLPDQNIKFSINNNNPKERIDPGTLLHIRTTDNILFRLYLCGNTYIDSPYFQNRFCLFLDSLTEQQKVIIELGTGINGTFPNLQLGMMISSIRNCRANVITLAAGRCGFSESCLFIYGKQKVISPYGALMFTGLKCYKDKIPTKYTQYFINIFKDALKEDIISEEVYNTLVSTGKSIMITEKETIIE